MELHGRADTLTQLRTAMAGSRLVTLWGPGGIGKTVLANLLAEELSLQPIVATGGALPAQLDDGTWILDGAEHHIDALVGLLPRWMRRPGVRILLTSRTRLRLVSEQVCPVRPLAPDAARALLQERLHAHAPAQPLPEGIDRMLDVAEGNPLAIELLAARLPLFSAAALEAAMDHPLHLLGRGHRGAAAQHRSMTACLESSWRGLPEHLQASLVAMSLYRGRFSVEDAVALLGDRALEDIEELRDRSLVHAGRAGALWIGGLLRHFVRDAAPPPGTLVAAHTAQVLTRAERWLARHERCGADLEALRCQLPDLAPLLHHTDAAVAGRAALSLGPLNAVPLEISAVLANHGPALAALHGRSLQRAGQLSEARAALERAVAGAEAVGDNGRLRSRALRDLGVLHHQRRAVEDARAAYVAAEACCPPDAERLRATCVGNLGALAHDQGHYEDAELHYRDALAHFHAIQDDRLTGIFQSNLALALRELGLLAESQDRLSRACALLDTVGDLRLAAVAHGNLGAVAHQGGDLELAAAELRHAREQLEGLGDPNSLALALAREAAVLADQDDIVGAVDRLDRVRTLDVDGLTERVVALHYGFVARARGDRPALDLCLAAARAAPNLGALSDDARAALRVLSEAPTLELGPDAAWFRLPGGDPVDISAYAANRRILMALFALRVDAPGEGMTVEDLFAAGWPGQRIQAESAANRVYVALAKLRKSGLRGVLLRDEAGYLLDPALAVRWAEGRGGRPRDSFSVH